MQASRLLIVCPHHTPSLTRSCAPRLPPTLYACLPCSSARWMRNASYSSSSSSEHGRQQQRRRQLASPECCRQPTHHLALRICWQGRQQAFTPVLIRPSPPPPAPPCTQATPSQQSLEKGRGSKQLRGWCQGVAAGGRQLLAKTSARTTPHRTPKHRPEQLTNKPTQPHFTAT
jgi:hypothetical protein